MDRAMPVLQVADITRSLAFYCDKLGFVCNGEWGDGPAFAIIQRGSATIALDKSRDAGQPVPVNQYWAAYIYVQDADALYAEYAAKGVDIPRAPDDRIYGSRDFDARDPDGHLIAFGHDLDS